MINEKNNEAKLKGEAVMPEDVATLYSWANLHGAKYRDFSATRQEARSQARNRAHLEQLEKDAEAENPAPVQAASPAVAEPPAPAPPPAQAKAEPAVRGAWEELTVPSPAAEQPAPLAESVAAPVSAAPLAGVYLDTPRIEPRPSEEIPPQRPGRLAQTPAGRPDIANDPLRQSAAAGFAPAIETPAHDRTSSRWYTLNSLLNQPGYGADLRQNHAREIKVPVLAVFSLAGGVGKTGMVATLGRALAARGEKVLLVDTSSYGLLPLYYGAQDVRPGVVRTFSGDPTQAPVQLLSLDAERYADSAGQHSFADDIVSPSQGSDRLLIDVATGSSSLTRQILRLAPTVLVPLVPDVSSLASLQGIETFFTRQSDAEGRAIEPLYILNRFDASLPLHHEMREILRQRLGERLLPIALRRTPALSEALAEGMTVVDYSPGSLIVEDYASLSSWLRNLSAPAGSVFRGHRWSEQ